jgi:hypothetical protein
MTVRTEGNAIVPSQFEEVFAHGEWA